MSAAALQKVCASEALNPDFRTHLRFVRADRAQAEYIYRLRHDVVLNRHLNPPGGDVDAQLEWLKRYKVREAAGEEFYFEIVSDGGPVGVVRIYDFRVVEGKESFCWGSLIIPPPRAPGLVTYVAVLIYGIGFGDLGLPQAHYDVRLANTRMIAFHERGGAQIVRVEGRDAHFIYSKAAYERFVAASQAQIEAHHRPAGA